ncbi:uncharacterized protein A4U43_C04F31450 [Asparagus officinalis]|uniref:Nucleotide-diphospho-sugar transferase domain-containing protein n=1 Tax=Asparagus officinalis TaxID=4686 RepID=A0A5P1F5P8_ASPOF|nr:uncharacterized protein LOC109838925 [Asparagus officinalis]ONK73434.1 uncharacterized protein A4U43_C04F31450 [Asparagus officinalis]
MRNNYNSVVGVLGREMKGDGGFTASRAAGPIAVVFAVLLFASVMVIYDCVWSSTAAGGFFRLQNKQVSASIKPRDELEAALQRASMPNKTVIIAVLNEAYAEENSLLDLFLRSFREGEDTEFLIKHLLLVAVDKMALRRCRFLGLHCYYLETEHNDFSEEMVFMSRGFVEMMWRRTYLLGEVLRRGYSFIFTDMDVLWLRNPFPKLSHNGEDMQISCDHYNENPFDESNPLNTGFYFVASNNKTIALFEEWYSNRKNSNGRKEQDVLVEMKNNGTFSRLNMTVRFLDTLQFSGFCEDSRDFREVRTVHANCCRIVKAKLADLAAALDVWKRSNGTLNATWPAHEGCFKSWQKDVSNLELRKNLEKTAMQNKTLIISVLSKEYSENNGILDLFLQSLQHTTDIKSLIRHILFMAIDKVAFDRCKLLNLHCHRLVVKGIDFFKEQQFTNEELDKVMWQRIRLLGDVLKLGYNFIYTDLDVMWLRNPFSKLALNGEDVQTSCDTYNGKPFDEINHINAGFYYVISNNKTTALFDKWYAYRYNSRGMKQRDVLNMMKHNGVFRQLRMKVKFLDTTCFSGSCEASMEFKEVITVNANCCGSEKAKLAYLTNMLEIWKKNNTTATRWPEINGCHQLRRIGSNI